MGVWAGNDDNSPMIDVSGITGAVPIWHDSMLVAEQGHPIQDFVNPGGLVRATVTYADGIHTTDLFLAGKVPKYAKILPSGPSHGNGHTQTLRPRGNASQLLSKAYCPASYSFVSPPARAMGWW